ALGALAFLGGTFMPDFREGHFVMQVSSSITGTSLEQMLALGKRVSTEVLALPYVKTIEQQVGRAELGEDTWGPHRSEFHVELKPTSGEEQEKMPDEIRKILDGFPGVESKVLTFLGDRIGETISGETAPVVVNIFGENLDLLDAKAQEVARLLKTVHGSADVSVKSQPGAPRLAIRLRPERLTQLGFRPVEVLESIQTAYRGTVVAQTHRGNQVSDV